MCKLVVKRKSNYDEVEFVGDYTTVIELMDKMMTSLNAGEYTYTISMIEEEDDDE